MKWSHALSEITYYSAFQVTPRQVVCRCRLDPWVSSPPPHGAQRGELPHLAPQTTSSLRDGIGVPLALRPRKVAYPSRRLPGTRPKRVSEKPLELGPDLYFKTTHAIAKVLPERCDRCGVALLEPLVPPIPR